MLAHTEARVSGRYLSLSFPTLLSETVLLRAQSSQIEIEEQVSKPRGSSCLRLPLSEIMVHAFTLGFLTWL